MTTASIVYKLNAAMATDNLIAYINATISSVLICHRRPTGNLIKVGLHLAESPISDPYQQSDTLKVTDKLLLKNANRT